MGKISKTKYSNCCGAVSDEDTGRCSRCKEHCEMLSEDELILWG